MNQICWKELLLFEGLTLRSVSNFNFNNRANAIQKVLVGCHNLKGLVKLQLDSL